MIFYSFLSMSKLFTNFVRLNTYCEKFSERVIHF